MFDNGYYTNLMTDAPIKYHELIIYPPTLKEVNEHALLPYYRAMNIHSLTAECFEGLDSSAKLLSMVFLRSSEFMESLAVSLKICLRYENIKFYSNRIELTFLRDTQPYLDKFVIDDGNFDDISDIIMVSNGAEKIKIEKPPPNLTPTQLALWEKLQAGRARFASKNVVHLYDIINICQFAGASYIPISEIEKWALWKIHRCYNNICCLRGYEDAIQICCVSGNAKSISGENHWTKKLLIR